MNWLTGHRKSSNIPVFPGSLTSPIVEARTWLKLFRGRTSVRCPCCDRVVIVRKQRVFT